VELVDGRVSLNNFIPDEGLKYPFIVIYILEETRVENSYKPERDERKLSFSVEIMNKIDNGPIESILDDISDEIYEALSLEGLNSLLPDNFPAVLWKLSWESTQLAYGEEALGELVGQVQAWNLEYQVLDYDRDLPGFQVACSDWFARARGTVIEGSDETHLED
jgi:hypothetical protein